MTNVEPTQPELPLTHTERRVIYRARRGLKELDMFFTPYVKNHYAQASESEKATFARLIEVEDPDLLDWFMNQSVPDEPEFTKLIEKIKSLRFKD